jgi:hypothetical protein
MICSNCRIPPSLCRSSAATRIWLHRTPYNPSLSPTKCLESISCICTKVDAHLNYDPLFINARLRLFLSDAHPYSTPTTTKLAFIQYLTCSFFCPLSLSLSVSGPRACFLRFYFTRPSFTESPVIQPSIPGPYLPPQLPQAATA